MTQKGAARPGPSNVPSGCQVWDVETVAAIRGVQLALCRRRLREALLTVNANSVKQHADEACQLQASGRRALSAPSREGDLVDLDTNGSDQDNSCASSVGDEWKARAQDRAKELRRLPCPGGEALPTEIATAVVACLQPQLDAKDVPTSPLWYRRNRILAHQHGMPRWSQGELRRACRGAAPLVDAVATELWLTLRLDHTPPAKLRVPLHQHFPNVRKVTVRSLGAVTTLDVEQVRWKMVPLERLLAPPQEGGSNGLTALDLSCCWATPSLLEASRDITRLALDLTLCADVVSPHMLQRALAQCVQLRDLELHRVEDVEILFACLEATSGLTSLSAELSLHMEIGLQRYTECFQRVSAMPLRRLHIEGSLETTEMGMVLGNASQLQVLHLAEYFNMWLDLPSEGGQLTALQSLYITHCSGMDQDMRGFFLRLCALRTLCITNCPSLRALSAGIRGLAGLRTLRIEGCRQLSLRNLESLVALERLHIVQCPHVMLSPYNPLEPLVNLTHLRLHINDTLLPATLSKMSQLRELDLSFCSQLTALPTSIGQLSQLRRLTLCRCSGLTRLPTSLAGLPALQEVRIEGCAALTDWNRCGLVQVGPGVLVPARCRYGRS